MKTAYFNRFTLDLPDDAVSDCSRQGECDSEVEYWEKKIDLNNISADLIRDELREYGAWESELTDDLANRQRIIWLAACNIKEEEKACK